jgi:hypothetical protein
MSVPADGNVKEFQPKPVKKKVGSSPAVSMRIPSKTASKHAK